MFVFFLQKMISYQAFAHHGCQFTQMAIALCEVFTFLFSNGLMDLTVRCSELGMLFINQIRFKLLGCFTSNLSTVLFLSNQNKIPKQI